MSEQDRFQKILLAVWHRIREFVVEFVHGIKAVLTDIFGSGHLMPLSTMLITFLIGWLITRFTLFPTDTETLDWRGTIHKIAVRLETGTSPSAAETRPQQQPPKSAKLAAAAGNNRYATFLLANIGTLKVVLAWVCVVLIAMAVWRLLTLLVLAGVFSRDTILKAQSAYVDPALSFVYDHRVYVTAFGCIVLSMVANLFLVLALFNPIKTDENQENQDNNNKPDARVFLNLALGVAALIFLVGFAITFALSPDES
jgi:hypothetical protein